MTSVDSSVDSSAPAAAVPVAPVSEPLEQAAPSSANAMPTPSSRIAHLFSMHTSSEWLLLSDSRSVGVRCDERTRIGARADPRDQRTTISPTIEGWTAQKYANDPASSKVNVKVDDASGRSPSKIPSGSADAPSLTPGTPPSPGVPDVTVCRTLSSLFVQVTSVPAAISNLSGEYAMFTTSIDATVVFESVLPSSASLEADDEPPHADSAMALKAATAASRGPLVVTGIVSSCS